MQMKNGVLNLAEADELPKPHGCIFLQKPFPDCFCMNLSSANIGKMLAFCTGDFHACLVYCQHTATGKSAYGTAKERSPAL